MARYSQDWSDFAVGTTESGLTGFSERGLPASMSCAIVSDGDAPSGKALRITRSNADASALVVDDFTAEQCDVIALLKVNAPENSANALTIGGIVGRFNGTSTSLSVIRGVYAYLGTVGGADTTSSDIRVRHVANTTTSIERSAVKGTWAVGTLYWLRLRIVDATVGCW